MAKEFKGEIKLDIRESTPDWPAFLPDRGAEGAPNVLVVLYDDTGLAAWSPYGGRINMPTMDRLAANGLDLLAVAHDRPVLADPVGVPDRSQPPPERVRLDLGDGGRVPRLQLAHPA